MNVYMIVVLLVPSAKAKHEGDVARIVVQPTAVIAKDEQTAAMKASRLVPEEYADKLDQLEVQIVPFKTAAR